MASEIGSVGQGGAAARDGAQAFPKRFYTDASVRAVDGGFALCLDGRPARTPGRNALVLPTKQLAEAIALEWSAVSNVIDPRTMPLTRLANTAIDGVRQNSEAVLDEVIRFAGSDLVVYRASEPDDLVRAQRKAWDGVVAWSRDDLQAPLTLAEGVMFVPQPAQSLAHIAAAIRASIGQGGAAPFHLGALHVMTTLTGSVLLALAVATKQMTAAEAWSAAHVDEDHQISLWGEDWEAAQRRAARSVEMAAAARLFALAADVSVSPAGEPASCSG